MRITSIAAAIAMLTIASVSMVQAAENFDTLARVQAVPMSDQELGDTAGGVLLGLFIAIGIAPYIKDDPSTARDIVTIVMDTLGG